MKVKLLLFGTLKIKQTCTDMYQIKLHGSYKEGQERKKHDTDSV